MSFPNTQGLFFLFFHLPLFIYFLYLRVQVCIIPVSHLPDCSDMGRALNQHCSPRVRVGINTGWSGELNGQEIGVKQGQVVSLSCLH